MNEWMNEMKCAILEEPKKVTFYKSENTGAWCRGGCILAKDVQSRENVPDLRGRLVK